MVVYKPTVITLEFSGGSLDGVAIRCRRPRLKNVQELARLIGTFDAEGGLSGVLSATADVVPHFLASATSWNLEGEEGAPWPLTRQGLEELDWEDLEEILTAWINNILGGESDIKDGPAEMELDLPVEAITP